jgi:hypothetical protein
MPEGIDTLSDREGHNEELIFGMVWLNLIRQDDSVLTPSPSGEGYNWEGYALIMGRL